MGKKVRSLVIRITETEEKLDKLKAQQKIQELRDKLKRKRRR